MFQSTALQQAQAKIGKTYSEADPETRQAIERMAERDDEVLIAIQTAQSRAFAMGLIPQAVAQDLYQAIGEGLSAYGRLSVPEQVVVMKCGLELMEMLRKRGAGFGVTDPVEE